MGHTIFYPHAAVAVQLLESLKAEKLRVNHWRDNEATRDAVRVAVCDYLWDEATGLPVDIFAEEDVEARAEDVFPPYLQSLPDRAFTLFQRSINGVTE